MNWPGNNLYLPGTRITWAAVALAIFGAAVLVFGALGNGSTMAMLAFLAGIILVFVALLTYFSPSRYIRDEVCDAMMVSSMTSLNSIVSSLPIASRGIFVPMGGTVALDILPEYAMKKPETEPIPLRRVVQDSYDLINGVRMQPPGLGLLDYAQSIGAALTDESLKNEIKEVVVNGLELASAVSVKREQGYVTVSMRDMASRSLCDQMRQRHPKVCTRISCPICGGIACMIAQGTGRKVRIGSVNVDSRVTSITYELL